MHGRGHWILVYLLMRNHSAPAVVPNDRAELPGMRQAGVSRWILNGAQDWLTGMISTMLMLTCGGSETTQRTVSAMSYGWSGLAPA